MSKRNLFAELKEGFESLALGRSSKKTLRTHKIESQATLNISAEEPIALRECLNLSRPVFAGYLRTNPRTMKNWNKSAQNQMLKQHF